VSRPPVTPYNTGRTGHYGAVRNSPADGGCGIGTYPCTHPGDDIVGPGGTVVVAPHDGWVIVSQPTDNPPFKGYGPAVVLLAHDDRVDKDLSDGERKERVQTGLTNPQALREAVVTNTYSLLAHLDPDNVRYSAPFDRARGLWDARSDAAGAKKNYFLSVDGTVNRYQSWPTWAQYVHEGDWLGLIDPDYGHVHWEIRKGPLELMSGNGTRNPREWLTLEDPSQPWQAAAPSPVSPRGQKSRSSGSGIVLLGLLWLATR